MRTPPLLAALFALFLQSAAAQTPDPIAEADRLFATAMADWSTNSTSERTEQTLARALALLQSVLPPTNPAVARVQDQLGRVHFNRGLATRKNEDFARAETLFAAAVAAGTASLDPKDLWLAAYHADLAAALREQNRLTDATRHVCRSLSIRRSVMPPDDTRLAPSLENLRLIRSRAGDLAGAKTLDNDLQRLVNRTIGSEDPATRALQKHCTGMLPKTPGS